MLFISHILLEFLLILVCMVLVVGLVRGLWAGRKALVRGMRVRAKDIPYYLFKAVLVGYVLWTFIGLVFGIRVLGFDGQAFRDAVFSFVPHFSSHAEAKATLGTSRYHHLLEEGASLAEMGAALKGAPSDPKRIAAVEHVLRGDIRDRTGMPLVSYTLDPEEGAITRTYATHPGLQRILGGFSPSPVRKEGLEWAYRDVLVPPQGEPFKLFQMGEDVQLSLHAGLQEVAYEALQINGQQRKGSVVVMNPHTGDVYAMVSSPASLSDNHADMQVARVQAALLQFHREMMRVSEAIRRPVVSEAAAATLQQLQADLKDVRVAVGALDHRFLPDTLDAINLVFNTVDHALGQVYQAIQHQQHEGAVAYQRLQETLLQMDRVRARVQNVHLQVLRSRFYAHEQMHFRQSAYSLGSAFKPIMTMLAEDRNLTRGFRMTLRGAHEAGVPRRILAFEQDHLPREDRRTAFNVEEGLTRSLNLVFAPLAKKMQESLGTEALVQYLESMGFNQEIRWHTAHEGLNQYFPIHRSSLYSDRLYPHREGYYRANIYSLGIGGENMMRVTPMHVAMMMSYLANETALPTPKIEPELPMRPFTRPRLRETALRNVKSYMHNSVTSRKGTSHALYTGDLKSIYLAAKTGTSTRMLSPYEIDRYGLQQRRREDLTGYHAWSVVLAGPAEKDIRAVVVVSINDAIPSGYQPETEQSEWASRIAVPVARDILNYMQQEGFFGPNL